MDYCMALLRNQNRETAFMVYVTDALKAIAENTAKFAGGAYMQKRFADYLVPAAPPPKSADIIRRFKNKFEGGAGS